MPCLPALAITLLLTGLASAQRAVSFPAQDGGLIYGDIYGSGSRAVVLLHGGRFDRANWKNEAAFLAAKGFIALAIDFRGEGKSRGGLQGPTNEDQRSLDV